MPRLSRMIFVRNRYLCILALSLAMAGCAVDPVPNEQLRLSEQAVAQARAVGATEQLAEMQLAEQKLAGANKNMGEQDYKRARVLAEEAELDARLALPRRATPRIAVPAGSLAITERQTAIYPHSSPGGWHLIGRCPWSLFDAARTPPCPLALGDRVRFRSIDERDFTREGGQL